MTFYKLNFYLSQTRVTGNYISRGLNRVKAGRQTLATRMEVSGSGRRKNNRSLLGTFGNAYVLFPLAVVIIFEPGE